jgi:hypothetical protein
VSEIILETISLRSPIMATEERVTPWASAFRTSCGLTKSPTGVFL